MANTPYVALKHHFDKLLCGGYQQNFYGSGFEPVRDTYERAFGKKINLFDVYQTALGIPHNPINRLITLIGPNGSDLDIPTGIMMSGSEITCVNALTEDIFKGIPEKDASIYVNAVYQSIQNVIMMDRFYADDRTARENPYMIFIKACPFYFTFHHIKECAPHLLKEKVFLTILEKYIATGEDADKILESISSVKFSPDSEIIYSTMTCKNSVDLFL